MNCGAVGFTFLWSIENYSYCPQKLGEGLNSPEFTVDGLDGIHWNIRLYPRGQTDQQRGYVSFSYVRTKLRPVEFPLNSEISFLSADGSALLEGDELLTHKKSIYLPQDALSLRWKLWKGESNILSLSEICARTRIGVEKIGFLLVAESFSALDSNQKKTVQIKSPSIKGRALTSSLYFSDCSCCPEKLMLEITPSDTKHALSHCKVSLLDGSGNKIECGEIDNRLDETGKVIDKIPLSLTRQDILSRESEYLPNDKLSLFCECSFTTGVDYEKIEKSELPESFVLLSRNKCVAAKLSTYCGMAILKCLFVAIISYFLGVCLSYLW